MTTFQAIPGRLTALFVTALATVLVLAATNTASAIERVTVDRDGARSTIEGRVMLENEIGEMMLTGRDGQISILTPDEIVGREKDARQFVPLDKDELQQVLLREMPRGFEVYQTKHYLVCYDTSRAYATWTGSLLERLYAGFTNYWSYRGFEMEEPEFPLVAVLFASKNSYINFARAEVGEAITSVTAYYSMLTNRLVMYDQTGVEARMGGNVGSKTSAYINRLMQQPGAVLTLATTVHEATHQIAFNSGLHKRLSDCPTWFSEGIAMFFETPDVTSSKGWRTIGGVNGLRMRQFREYARRRPANSLERLLANDDRLRNPDEAGDAYAESWALTYYLIKQRPKEYVKYLQLLSAKKVQVWDDREKRLADFKSVFGDDLRALDRAMLTYFSRLTSR